MGRKQKVTITLNKMPTSTQHIYVNKGYRGRIIRFLNAKAVEFKKQLTTKTKKTLASKKGFKPFSEPNLLLTLDLYVPTRRKCDVDNFSKLILDSLNGLVYVDDSLIQEMIVRKFYRKGLPGIKIVVMEKFINNKKQEKGKELNFELKCPMCGHLMGLTYLKKEMKKK